MGLKPRRRSRVRSYERDNHSGQINSQGVRCMTKRESDLENKRGKEGEKKKSKRKSPKMRDDEIQVENKQTKASKENERESGRN